MKCRRAEEIEDVLRKEFEKARKAEAYANNILSCGVGMYEHCNGIQKFLQSFATNQGVPIGEIPPPPVPPPARSLSPPRSPQQSTIQILENSDELLTLCAQQQANPSSGHGLEVGSNVPVAADDEGIDVWGLFQSVWNWCTKPITTGQPTSPLMSMDVQSYYFGACIVNMLVHVI